MINADGTGFQQMTKFDANSYYPTFSPFGKSVVYASSQNGGVFDLFLFLFEGQRTRQKSIVSPIVLTQSARNGLFRYFPGAQNAGATAVIPTVDLAGKPLKPAKATGDLRSISVFGLDPLRPGPDQSG